MILRRGEAEAAAEPAPQPMDLEELWAALGPEMEPAPEREPQSEAEPPPQPRPEPETPRAPEPEPEPEPEPQPPPPPEPVHLASVPEPPPEPEEEPAATEPALEKPEVVMPLVQRDQTPREWNLWELERIASQSEGPNPQADEERALLLITLRQFAEPSGDLPVEFDPLVRDAFGGVLAQGPV